MNNQSRKRVKPYNSFRVTVDIKALVRHAKSLINMFQTTYQHHAHRIDLENLNIANLVDFIINAFYNRLMRTASYTGHAYEEEMYLKIIMEDYTESHSYKGVHKELVIQDEASFLFHSYFVEGMYERMDIFIEENGLVMGSLLFEVNTRGWAIIVTTVGEWYARQYCIDNDIEYNP